MDFLKFILVISVFIFSCKNTISNRYPKVVHNKCTDKWAIKTGFGKSNSIFTKDGDLYFGTVGFFLPPDTIIDAYIGDELTFNDSLTALNTYNDFLLKNKRQLFIKDSTRKSKDSIFNCQHNYE